MTRRIAGLLLAAGAGSRYGMPKALVARDGRLLVELAVTSLREGGCDPVVVVLGAAADEIREKADLGISVVVMNPDWQTGMGSSLRAGLAASEQLDVDAVAVLLVDTPGITAAAIARVLAAAEESSVLTQTLVTASYDDRPGHPVVLGREHWAGVSAVAIGEAGARPYLDAHRQQLVVVPCEDLADGADIDVPAGGR